MCAALLSAVPLFTSFVADDACEMPFNMMMTSRVLCSRPCRAGLRMRYLQVQSQVAEMETLLQDAPGLQDVHKARNGIAGEQRGTAAQGMSQSRLQGSHKTFCRHAHEAHA